MENTDVQKAKETLLPREVAVILDVNVVTVRKMCRDGKYFEVKNIGIGKKKPTYRIVKDSFEQYLKKQEA